MEMYISNIFSVLKLKNIWKTRACYTVDRYLIRLKNVTDGILMILSSQLNVLKAELNIDTVSSLMKYTSCYIFEIPRLNLY